MKIVVVRTHTYTRHTPPRMGDDGGAKLEDVQRALGALVLKNHTSLFDSQESESSAAVVEKRGGLAQ